MSELIVVGEQTKDFVERTTQEFMYKAKALTMLMNADVQGEIHTKYEVREGYHLNCFLRDGQILDQTSTTDGTSFEQFDEQNPFIAHSLLFAFRNGMGSLHLFHNNQWQTYIDIATSEDIDNLAYEVFPD